MANIIPCLCTYIVYTQQLNLKSQLGVKTWNTTFAMLFWLGQCGKTDVGSKNRINVGGAGPRYYNNNKLHRHSTFFFFFPFFSLFLLLIDLIGKELAIIGVDSLLLRVDFRICFDVFDRWNLFVWAHAAGASRFKRIRLYYIHLCCVFFLIVVIRKDQRVFVSLSI